MANKNLLKKIAPVILSATVAMTGMPSAVFAAELSDEEVVLDGSAEDEETDVEIADAEADEAASAAFEPAVSAHILAEVLPFGACPLGASAYPIALFA